MSTWKNKEYEKLAFDAVAKHGTNLLAMTPGDAVEWGLTEATDKASFYVNLLGALAVFESRQNPAVSYEESFQDASGQNVVSRGLLQLSIESGNGYLKRLGLPRMQNAEELHDPAFNLKLGVIILDRWLAADGVITGGTKGKWLGAARYWSPFRKTDRILAMQKNVKNNLTSEDSSMKMVLKSVPKYGDHGKGDVKLLQSALQRAGYDPGPIDDWLGDKTLKALKAFQKANGLSSNGVIPADGGKTFEILGLQFSPPQENEIKTRPVSAENYFGAPWIGVNIDFLGKDETDAELNSRYVPEWAKCGLPGYKTLAGRKYAWCSIFANANLRAVGIEGTNSAGAASWSKWGRKCDFFFGSVLDIKHKAGGRHVGFFLFWLDEKKKIAAVLGGNQNNKFAISRYNLEGSDDVLVTGPRWPKDSQDGEIVSMAQVTTKYPFLKI